MDFSKMAEYMESKKKMLDSAIVSTVEETVDNITLDTPIKTGNARYNWQTAINSPSFSMINWPEDDGETSFVQAGVPSPAYYAALGNAQTDIEEAPGNIFWFANTAGYILALEYGYSGQSSYMLQKNVAVFGERFYSNLRRHNG